MPAMMPAAMQAPAAILLLTGGLVTCLFGHRLFRLVLGIYGFLLGALIASSLMGAAETTALLVATVAGGLVGAALLIVAYFIGVALVGAALGALLVRVIWAQLDSDPQVLIVVGASLLGALIALALQRYVIIVGTALGGAWSALIGGSALLGAPDVAFAAERLESWLAAPVHAGYANLWVVAVWLALGSVGIIVQFAITARGR